MLRLEGLAHEDVVPGNRLERFRGKGQVHRVAGLVLEVYHEAGKDRVHRLDAPKAPAPVHAKARVRQLNQGFNVMSLQLAGGCHFLELVSHKVS